METIFLNHVLDLEVKYPLICLFKCSLPVALLISICIEGRTEENNQNVKEGIYTFYFKQVAMMSVHINKEKVDFS